MNKLIIRTLGLLAGVACVLFGVFILIAPIFDTFLEVINGITGIIIGVVFIYYAATTRSLVKDIIKKWM